MYVLCLLLGGLMWFPVVPKQWVVYTSLYWKSLLITGDLGVPAFQDTSIWHWGWSGCTDTDSLMDTYVAALLLCFSKLYINSEQDMY